MSIEQSLERIAITLEIIADKVLNPLTEVDLNKTALGDLGELEPEKPAPKKTKVKAKAKSEPKSEPEDEKAHLAIDDVRAAAKILIDTYPKTDRTGFKQAQKVLMKFGADKMVDLKPEKFEAAITELTKEARAVKQ